MAALDARRISRTTAKSVALVALVPFTAFAQPLSPPDGDDAVQAIVRQVDEIQSRRGMNSSELIEPLAALSSLYESRGADQLAAAFIERARQVIRVNYGLHTLDEVPLMQRSIRIEEARGNAEAAWDQEQLLLALVRRHPYDARTVETLRDVADKRMAMLARYRAGEFPPEIILGCYYDEQTYDAFATKRGGCRAGSKRKVIGAIRAEAVAYRTEAANIADWRARWVEEPCARPPMPHSPAGRLAKRGSKSLAARRLAELSDYAGCTQVKHEHARSAQASAEELSELAARHRAAVREMQEHRAVYEQSFGPIRAAGCLGKALRVAGSASRAAAEC